MMFQLLLAENLLQIMSTGDLLGKESCGNKYHSYTRTRRTRTIPFLIPDSTSKLKIGEVVLY